MTKPFTLHNPLGGGYRIEEIRGNSSVLPDVSIYRLLESVFGDVNKGSYEKIVKRVDYLNEQVQQGKIVLDGDACVAPEYD